MTKKINSYIHFTPFLLLMSGVCLFEKYEYLVNLYYFLFAVTNPSSPFKKPLIGNLNQSILGGLSSNASDSGSSMATTSSSGSSGSSSTSNKRPPSLTDSPFQSGHLPTIADVRSPDVLHPQDGPCDCLSHPMQVCAYLLFFYILENYSTPLL